MILAITKFHEILLKDRLLPLLSIVKFFSSSETKMILRNLFKNHQIQTTEYPFPHMIVITINIPNLHASLSPNSSYKQQITPFLT